MECWIPLFDIFMNSPCPESEASLWLQKSFDPSSNTTPISTTSFLALLTKSSHPTSVTPQEKRVMWIQTLPDTVQARILSFLACDHQRFSNKELCKLARIMLSEGTALDFWVKKAAEQLLDLVSVSNYESLSHLNLDTEEENMDDELHSIPDWLRDAAEDSEPLFPWLPLSPDEFSPEISVGVSGHNEVDTSDAVEDGKLGDFDEVMEEDDVDKSNFDDPKFDDPVASEVENRAKYLKEKVLNLDSASKAVELAKEICELCVESRGKTLDVLHLIEPWNADDETAAVLISHLSDRTEGHERGWPSHVLCSVVLPKFLVLNEPCSRVLLTAAIYYCKKYQREAEYELLLPLILRSGGINKPMCDLITRIVKECLHPAHVSAFCQKLLSRGRDAWRFICLPCHQYLIGDELVWTESLFSLMQNILNHNVHLTQDSVDQLVDRVCEFSVRYSTSLKFGNFLLLLVSKCAPLLKPHKLLLTGAVENTNTLVTKSVLSKLSGL